jgi:hypothetical protein
MAVLLTKHPELSGTCWLLFFQVDLLPGSQTPSPLIVGTMFRPQVESLRAAKEGFHQMD